MALATRFFSGAWNQSLCVPYGTRRHLSVFGMLPYQSTVSEETIDFAASVSCLAPLHLRRRLTRPVSCYAFFKGWLLLSQPPGCLCVSTSFTTEHKFRDLSWRSGLFPFRPRNLSPVV